MVVATVIAVLVVLVVVNLLNHRWRSHWYVRTCLVATVVVLAIGVASGLTRDELGLGKGAAVSGLIWGAAGVLLVLLAYAAGVSIPRTRRFFVDERLSDRGGPAVMRHALIEVPFGTVLLEEAAFRGVLFASVASSWGNIWGVAVSSAVFGVWHVLPALAWHESNEGIATTLGERHERARGLVVLLTVVGTAAAGVLFCVLRIDSGSLLAPMAFHWATNGLGLFFIWAIRRR